MKNVIDESNKKSVSSCIYGFYYLTFAYIFERQKYDLAKHIYNKLISETESKMRNSETAGNSANHGH